MGIKEAILLSSTSLRGLINPISHNFVHCQLVGNLYGISSAIID